MTDSETSAIGRGGRTGKNLAAVEKDPAPGATEPRLRPENGAERGGQNAKEQGKSYSEEAGPLPAGCSTSPEGDHR